LPDVASVVVVVLLLRPAHALPFLIQPASAAGSKKMSTSRLMSSHPSATANASRSVVVMPVDSAL
jgi:hypothetical protein